MQWTYDGCFHPYKHRTSIAYKWTIMRQDISKKQAGTYHIYSKVRIYISIALYIVKLATACRIFLYIKVFVLFIFENRLIIKFVNSNRKRNVVIASYLLILQPIKFLRSKKNLHKSTSIYNLKNYGFWFFVVV